MSLTPEVSLRLYRGMLRIRIVEEKIAQVYAEQEMRCPVHLCVGQEAIAVGVCANLEPTDYAFGTHRAHGHYLAKGGSLLGLMGELYGRASGCCQGRGGSMHLVDISSGFLGAAPIVGSTIPIAVGAAFGTALQGFSHVTVAFFGEGATEEGVFHEAMNFAALRRLPVVFVCENNGFSVYSSLEVRQPVGLKVHQLAAAHGMESQHGDGNNVVEVYEIAGEAIHKARQGGGPTFLEFKTGRWREHCGPNYDDDLGYREERVLEEMKRACPVTTFRERLLREGLLSDSENAALVQELTAEVEQTLLAARQSPYPEMTSVWDEVYAK
jgi:TPP-dependent pyruvate/acetoin dehydrogenase alpha subunit